MSASSPAPRWAAVRSWTQLVYTQSTWIEQELVTTVVPTARYKEGGHSMCVYWLVSAGRFKLFNNLMVMMSGWASSAAPSSKKKNQQHCCKSSDP